MHFTINNSGNFCMKNFCGCAENRESFLSQKFHGILYPYIMNVLLESFVVLLYMYFLCAYMQVCVVKETYSMAADASHPGYAISTPSKHMEVGM